MCKRLLIITLAAIIVAPLVFGFPNGTAVAYTALRTVTATEDAQLTSSTQSTAPDASADGCVYTGSNVGTLIVRLKGTAAENKTLSWTLWAYRSGADPAEYVANGTATTGATQTGTSNEFYCDTIAITAQSWYSTVSVIDGAPDAIVNGGGIAKLIFDSAEYQYFKVIIRDIAGGGNEAATAGADICNYR